MLPWRIKSFFSTHTPVLYYLLNNLRAEKNSGSEWDAQLAAGWDDVSRSWPNRCKEIQALINRDHKVLDVGCGTGGILRELKKSGFTDLHGLEHSLYAVRRLRDHGISMIEGQLPDIAVADNTFDILIASEVLEHILFQRRFVREIIRSLKPDGRAFIFVPNDCLGPIDEPSHVRIYSKSSLAKLLGQFGAVESVSVTGEDHFEASFLFAILRKAAE